MRLFQGLGLPSDQIRVRLGFEGTEPDEVLSRSPQVESSQTRVAIVINTFHPEIQGGYYLNRSLIGLIQDVLGDLGLHVVWNEAFGSAEIVPVEERSSLQLDEDYLLVDDKLETKGNVFLWRYAVAGGGAFYSDDVVVDIRVAEGMALRFRSRLEIDLPPINESRWDVRITSHLGEQGRQIDEEETHGRADCGQAPRSGA